MCAVAPWWGRHKQGTKTMNTNDNTAKAVKVEQEQARAKMAKVFIKATSLKAAAYKVGGVAFNGFSIAIDYKDGKGGQLLTEEIGGLAKQSAEKYIAARKFTKTAKSGAAIYRGEQIKAAGMKADALKYGRPVRRYTKAVVLAAEWVEIMNRTGRPAYLSDKVAEQLEQARAAEAEWENAEAEAKEQARAKWEETHPEQAAKRRAKEQAKAVMEAAKEQAKAIMAKVAA